MLQVIQNLHWTLKTWLMGKGCFYPLQMNGYFHFHQVGAVSAIMTTISFSGTISSRSNHMTKFYSAILVNQMVTLKQWDIENNNFLGNKVVKY